MRFYQTIFCIVTLVGFLTGCASTALTGMDVAYNRYSFQKEIENKWILLQAHKILYEQEEHLKHSDIEVAVYDYQILLLGQTRHPEIKQFIERKMWKISGVKQVHNEIYIARKSSWVKTLKDSWITFKIRSKLYFYKDVDPKLIKVVTENSTVYLLGFADEKMNETINEVINRTSGVKNIEKHLTYIHYSPAA